MWDKGIQNVLKLILKSHRFVPFGANLTQFWMENITALIPCAFVRSISRHPSYVLIHTDAYDSFRLACFFVENNLVLDSRMYYCKFHVNLVCLR